MQRWGLLAAWIIATVAATVVAWQAVDAAGDRVLEEPVTPLVASTQAAPGTTSQPPATGSVSTAPPATTPSITGADPPPATTTPTVATTPESPPTTGEAAWTRQSVPTPGGTLVVDYRPGEVKVVTVTPAPGFAVDDLEERPDEVRVEFESALSDHHVAVRWTSGGLQVEVGGD